MKLYLIWQERNKDYDTYDSAVVAAETEEAAQNTHPGSAPGEPWKEGDQWSWTDPEYVLVREIGEALPGTSAGVICASFNAA